MQVQNRATNRPWAGSLVLVLAVGLAGLLLAGPGFQGETVLNTWYLTRAAGLLAYLLLWAAAALGLLQSLGMLKGLTAPTANLDLHTFVSLGAIYTTVFHAVILLFDRYVPFGWADLLIPFASGHEPLLVGLGIIAFYLSLLVTVTTYLRARFKPQHWRIIHWSSLVGFGFALIHGAVMGTDTAQPVVSYMYRFTGLLIGLLLLYRTAKGVFTHHAPSAGRR